MKEESRPFVEDTNTLHQSNILPRQIKQWHLESNLFAIKFGLSTERPDGSSHTKAWFSTDTNELSIYNGTSWVSVSLS